jgi:hypothetical protein
MNTQSSTEGYDPADPFSAKIALFKSARGLNPIEYISVRQFIDRMAFYYWEQQIIPFRDLIQKGDKEGYSKRKHELPAVTLSGSCVSRKQGEEHGFEHSGWLQADFDLKDNLILEDPEVSQDIRAALFADPYVGFVFVGPSGQGIKAGVLIDPTRHEQSWKAAEVYFSEKYSLTMDKATKDPMRLCFVSLDPLTDVSMSCKPLPITDEIVLSGGASKSFISSSYGPPSSDEIAHMLSFIPPRPDYDTWLKIASAVWSVLPMGEGSQVLNDWSPEERDGEYAQKHRVRLERVGIGTLRHIAKQHGFDPSGAFKNHKRLGFDRVLKDRDTGPAIVNMINGKPALRLPYDGYLVSQTAAELGKMLSPSHRIFCRKGAAFTLDHEDQKLELALSAWLRTWIERHVTPYKLRIVKDGEIKITHTMADDTARAVLVSPHFLEQLPVVERFHPCPMPWLRSNGKIELLPVGLDEESQTFTSDPGFSIEPDTLEGARCVLDNLLQEFSWPNDGGRSKAVHISAMLTVFAGGIMPKGSTRPVFLYVANSEGSGKTTLALVCGIPYASIPVETAPNDESEWQKKLLSAVISGRRVLLLDNVKGHLNSGALEAYTTSSYFSGRVLGVSKEFSGEAGATVLITGNGLTVTPDLRRRSLFIELFLQELRCEDRSFKRTLDLAGIAIIRPEVLSALWGLVKAWDEAGRPAASKHNSSFPRWSETIAGIVEYAGFGIPTAASEIDGMGDTDTTDFMSLVQSMHCGQRYTFEQIARIAIEKGLFERITQDLEADELSKRANSAFGKLLKRFDRRRVTASGVFFVEGKGKSRRYVLLQSHG